MLGFVFGAFIVITGLAALVTASILAARPSERTLAILRPLSAAVVFSSVSAVFAGAAVALKHAADSSVLDVPMLFGGLAEAAVPGVFGFGFLAVAWLLAAIGLRRQA